MNGINPEHVGEEKADELCQILIEDSCAQFGHEKAGIEHASGEKLLHRYWYRKSTGNVESHTSRRGTEVKDTPQEAIDMKMFDDVVGGATGSVKGLLAIKMENPAFTRFTELLKLAGSALKVLEKLWTEGKNVQAAMAAKAVSQGDQSLQKAAGDMQAMMKTLNLYNEEFRSMLATGQCFNSGDDLGEWPKKLEDQIANAESHIDGNKAMLKRMKSKLT